MSDGRLEGQRILVVGAGTQRSDDPEAPVGNGRAIAVAAAREGATVVCADRDRDAAEETRRGSHARADRPPWSSPTSRPRRRASSWSRRPRPTASTASCSTSGSGAASGWPRRAEDWDLTFAVNLRAHFLVAREALPQARAEGGAIVFIGSVAGLQPGSGLPAYDASKAGLDRARAGTSRSRARAAGVRANVARARADRHAARSVGVARATVARAHAGAAAPAGDRAGRSRRRRCSCSRTTRATSPGRCSPVDGGLTLI